MTRGQPISTGPSELEIIRMVFLNGRLHGRLSREGALDFRPETGTHLELPSRAGKPEVVRVHQVAWMPDRHRFRVVVGDARFRSEGAWIDRMAQLAHDGWHYTIRGDDPILRDWRDANCQSSGSESDALFMDDVGL